MSCANFAGLRRIWCSAGHLIGRTWIRNHLAKNPKQPFLPREHAGWKKLNSGASALRLKQKNNSVYNQQISDNQLLSIISCLLLLMICLHFCKKLPLLKLEVNTYLYTLNKISLASTYSCLRFTNNNFLPNLGPGFFQLRKKMKMSAIYLLSIVYLYLVLFYSLNVVYFHLLILVYLYLLSVVHLYQVNFP